MPVDTIQPSTLFIFQWLIIFTFILVGDGYFRTIIRNAKYGENLLSTLFHRLVFGMVLLIVTQFVASFIFSIFTILTVGYLLLGIALEIIHFSKTVIDRSFTLGELRNNFSKFLEDKNLVLFLIILCFVSIITSFSLSGYIGSTNHDAATHSFYTRIILEQQKIPITAQPFHDYFISYPLGVHTLLAAFVILGVPIYSVVIVSTSLLPLMSSIAAYSSFNMIFKSHSIAVISGSITGLCSRTIIAPLAWGGVTSGIANVFVLVFLGFSFQISMKHETTKSDLLLSSIILGTMPWLHPAAAIFAIIWLVVCFISSFFIAKQNKSNVKSYSKILKRWFALGIMTFIILLPYMLRILTSLSINNQGYPPDIPNLPSSGISNESRGLLALLGNIFVDIFGLSYYGSLFGSIYWIFPFSILAAIFIRYLKKSSLYQKHIITKNPTEQLYLYPTVFFWISLLFYIVVLYFLIPSLPINSTISVALQAIIVRLFYEANIFLIPLTSITLYAAFKSLEITCRERFYFSNMNNRRRRRIVTWVAVFIISSGTLIMAAPSVYNDSKLFYGRIISSQAMYNTLTSDDIYLMHWMVNHIPEGSTILVGYNDAGEYVSTVTGFRSIYEYAERIRSSTNYNNLLSIICTNPLNTSALPLLEEFNITHIFIGAKSQHFTSGQLGYTLNATDLQRAPWFRSVRIFGNATLLSFSP